MRNVFLLLLVVLISGCEMEVKTTDYELIKKVYHHPYNNSSSNYYDHYTIITDQSSDYVLTELSDVSHIRYIIDSNVGKMCKFSYIEVHRRDSIDRKIENVVCDYE